MMVRKPQKFSQNSSETVKSNREKNDSFISSVTDHKRKSAADTASSILEELGVKKSNSNKIKKNNSLNIQRKSPQKKDLNLEFEKTGSRILEDLKKQKNLTDTKIGTKTENIKKEIKSKQNELNELKKTNNQKKSNQITDKYGLHEIFVFFVLICITFVTFLGYIGGYIKIFDLAVLNQIFSGNQHQLEFVGGFGARQVENGYNRVPLFVVEGTIQNTHYESDNIEKIQLKAHAFNHDEQLIDSHFTYSGFVLSDEQLENLSPIHIKALRQSGDLSILNPNQKTGSQTETSDIILQNKKEVPFQVVFFKDVSTIHSTSIEIVSYVRNRELVFLESSNRF